jgi:hypothetical protein
LFCSFDLNGQFSGQDPVVLDRKSSSFIWHQERLRIFRMQERGAKRKRGNERNLKGGHAVKRGSDAAKKCGKYCGSELL